MANLGMRYYMDDLESMAQSARDEELYAAGQVYDMAISLVNYGHGKPDSEFLSNCLRSSRRNLNWVQGSNMADRAEEIAAWRNIVDYFQVALELVTSE